MQNKRNKKELTRLILTALILGSGSLYGPVAEAATQIEVTGSPGSINSSYAGQLEREENKVYALSPNVAWTLNSTDSYWKDFLISGGYTNNDGILTGYRITLAQGKVEDLIGGWAQSTAIPYNNHVYMTGGEANEVVGGSSSGNVGWVDQGVDKGNTVNISGGTVKETLINSLLPLPSLFLSCRVRCRSTQLRYDFTASFLPDRKILRQ